MKEEYDNSRTMAGPSGADLFNELCVQRGIGNGKEFRMTVSNKGKRSLMREGYMYRLDHSGKDKLSWRCSTRGCPAHLKTNHSAEIIVQDNEKSHTHTVDAHRFEKQILRAACKRKAVEDCSSRTQDIISSELTRLCAHQLSPQNTKFLQLAMYRERKKICPQPPRLAPSGRTNKHLRLISTAADIATNTTADIATNTPADISTNTPADIATNTPADIATNTPANISKNIPSNISNNIPSNISNNIPSNISNNIPSDIAANIPQLHCPTLPTAVYSRASTYEPHFDLLTDDACTDYNHHHPNQQHDDDSSIQRHPQQLHHQLLHHQLRPSETNLPQTVYPSNHPLPGSHVMAVIPDRETTECLQLSHCETRTEINYTSLKAHEDLLLDKVRTLTYRRALQENRAHLQGATLLEVGAGTGILSHFAVQAGATKVYAVEPTGMAAFADRVAKENGLGSVISVQQTSIEAADIPVKVDAIICEWMGDSLLCQRMLPSLLTARDRYLRQGGDMYPCTATLYLAPINDLDSPDRLTSWTQMKSLYGVSMDSGITLARAALEGQAVRRHLDGESVLANACQVAHLDLKTMRLKDAQLIKAEFTFRCYSRSTMHGFATWFLAYFPGTVVLDTSPYALKTNWGQTGLYLKAPVSVHQDSEIRGIFTMQPSAGNLTSWDIQLDFQLNRDRSYSQLWQCVSPR